MATFVSHNSNRMPQAYLVDAIRTPIGRHRGALSALRPDDLLAGVLRALWQRHPTLPPDQIEDVIAGDGNQAGEDNRNVARMAALLAGLPVTVPGTTVNRLCASGLQAIMDAARAIRCGEGMAYLAAGVESMSRAPWVISRFPGETGAVERADSTIGWRFANPALTSRYYPFSMGETAEHLATQWGISREEQDDYAVHSHEKYWTALAAGRWREEILPVEIPDGKTVRLLDTDEPPRHTTREMLARLKPAFAPGGTVTAGNSSGINDGAAALLIVSEEALRAFSLTPVARIVSMAVAGVDPAVMGIGPVPATQKALQRAGLQVGDLDLIELNEAFACQSIACIRDLELDPQRTNIHGGAIALGHPIGCTGARIVTTLLHDMRIHSDVRYGLATTCVGIGQGAAMILEKM
jgi:acetyl-CoA C-acetyltransferase